MKLWEVNFYIAEGGEQQKPPFQYVLADSIQEAVKRATMEETEYMKVAKISLFNLNVAS